MRRALARISMTVQCGLSSMKSFASASRPTAWPRRDQSPSLRRAVHKRVASTRASIASRRFVSSSVPISIEKKMTGRPVDVATLRAIPSARLVLPIPGRAAMITRFSRWSPWSFASRSVKPVGTPTSSESSP